MIRHYFRIEIDGLPVRLYVNSRTKKRLTEPDNAGADRFVSVANAEKRAVAWGLTDYKITPFDQDVGDVTNLTELGF